MGTFTQRDALNLIRKHISAVDEADYAAQICNAAVNTIWMAFDFRETLEKLPPFWLTPNEQDHGAPAVVIPQDFLGLRIATLTQLDVHPIPNVWDLAIIRDLKLTAAQDYPRSIGYNPENNSFRVFPRVPENIGVPSWLIQGRYKKKPPVLTSTTFANSLIPFQDIYFDNYLDVLLWAAYNRAGDQRAGQVQSQKGGGVAFTGQFAKANSAILYMAENEGLELNDPVIAPSEPLVDGGLYGYDVGWSGGYGVGF